MRSRSVVASPTTWLRLACAALILVIAGVHFQQYVSFMSHVPTVGVLFLLNAAGGAGLAIALLGRDPIVVRLAALGAIGLAAGSLACVLIALASSFAGFHEPSLRTPIVIAILAEALALPACGRLLIGSPSEPAAAPERSGGDH